MAGITELKALVGDNQEASAIVQEIENTMISNQGRVTDLERQTSELNNKLAEAIQSRDKVKNTIKQELGIEEFTPDAIKARLSTYAADDVIAARDRQFQELKIKSSEKLDELQNELNKKEQEMNKMRLNLAISKTDVMGQVKSEHAADLLLQWVGENAEFDENGNIVYKGPNGETLFNDNSNPMTLEDRINEIKGDSSRDFIFEQRFLAGGGAPTGNDAPSTGSVGAPGPGQFARTKMSLEEKKNYRAKYGEEAYNALPLI